MSREITHHGAVIEAISRSGIISELIEKHEDHFEYELDLEVMVYGRNYTGKKVGPYARLYVYGAGEEIIHEGDWGGNRPRNSTSGASPTPKVEEVRPPTRGGLSSARPRSDALRAKRGDQQLLQPRTTREAERGCAVYRLRQRSHPFPGRRRN